MPRDVSGISRIGMFEQIVTPSGDTFSPTGGTATRVNLKSTSGKRITVSSCDRSPTLVDYKASMAQDLASDVPGMVDTDD